MNIFQKIWFEICDSIKNILDQKTAIFYISDKADWVVRSEGLYLTEALQNIGIPASIRFTARFIQRRIVHFASVGTLLSEKGFRYRNRDNKIVLSWFHVAPEDPRAQYIPALNEYVDCVHTTAKITKETLIKKGLHEDKITIVPLGIDLEHFRPAQADEKKRIREKLSLPPDAFIIGSFQKDGNGWGEGNTPKLVKGPDIFCDVLETLPEEKREKIHVLLTGPSRGYVMKRLQKANISFTHNYLKNYSDIVNYFHALDCYLIASRVEGGPKALLESWATGVPLISTKIGMPADHGVHGENLLFAEVGDVEKLRENLEVVMDDEEVRIKLIQNGGDSVKKFSWEKTASQYRDQIYRQGEMAE